MITTNRYFIRLAYRGTAYHGWQWQENALTVQQVLEECMGAQLGAAVSLTGAGRTDTGVHAREFYAHFDHPVKFKKEELHDMVYKLNAFLPGDICIFNIYPVARDAHARFDAISRTYEYVITTRKDPFNIEFAWYLKTVPDVELLNRGAKVLFDYEDFTSFSKLHTQVKTNVCLITEASWEQRGHLLVFRITADRFLRNMVRAITGTLLDLGYGRISPDGMKKVIESRDRSLAGMSVPAHGLFLDSVRYPDSIISRGDKPFVD